MLWSLLCVLLYIVYHNKGITVQNHFHNSQPRFCICTLISVGKKPSDIHEVVTNETQSAMSDQRQGGMPGTVKVTHICTILLQPIFLPSIVQKMLITIKGAF